MSERSAYVTSPLPGADALLDIRGLRVTRRPRGRLEAGGELLHGIDLDLPVGGRLGIVGESGSGKTLTTQVITNLLPTSLEVSGGTVRLGGKEVLSLPVRERRRLCSSMVALIPQDAISALDPYERVGSQLVANLRHSHPELSRSQAREVVDERLAEVGLDLSDRDLRRFPNDFSGGMRQRMVISMALEGSARLLVADEPTTSLDAVNQTRLLDLMGRLCEERGMGLLFVSHNLGLVARMCDDVVVMRSGSVVERASRDELLEHPRDPYARRLVETARELMGGDADGR